jgi:site-specific DNA recombinase
VRPRARVGRDGGTINPTHFMVGPLDYLLKNRFYIGEVVYRGEVHPGEQQPIVDKELFEAVQAKLKDRAVARKVRRSRSPSFLSGLLFDDRGNLMSPSPRRLAASPSSRPPRKKSTYRVDICRVR